MKARHYPSNSDPHRKALCGRKALFPNPTRTRKAYSFRVGGNPNRDGMCQDCRAIIERWDA